MPKYINTLPESTVSSTPLNKSMTSELGESIVIKQDIEEYRAITVKESNIDKRYFVFAENIKTGGLLVSNVSTKDYVIYEDIIALKQNVQAYSVAVEKETGKGYLAIRMPTGLSVKPQEVEYSKTKAPVENCNGCFKQEMVFNGRVNNSLKFVYREYSGDLIRPAFNQELQYDLNESNIIGFKGLRLKVQEANNISITYTVLQGFD
jgi:hypothetical protein